MLLNTWLTAAKRQLFKSSSRISGSGRRSGLAGHKPTQSEALESRTLLTALVINNNNVDAFVDATGNLSITNTELGAHDSLIIEQVDLLSTDEAISIDLTGVPLERLAIETVNVTAFSGTAIDINLTNVTGNRTIALEDISIANSGAGIAVNLDNTDSLAVTIEDTVTPTIHVTATNGSDIGHGVITENEVIAPADLEAVVVTVDSVAGAVDTSSTDDFHIINNSQIQALNRDAVQVNLTNTPTDGLTIANNEIGNEPGADVFFLANGDTFVQPFELTNNALDGEQLQQFTLDLRPLGLVFDTGTDGKPFTVTPGSDVTAAEATATLTSNDQVLTVDLTGFTPGETLLFVIDVDIAPDVPGGAPIATPIFGNDLIGALVQFNFDAGNTGTVPKQVAGVMVGSADIFNASVFARGAGAAANVHGINLNLDNSVITNTEILENVITGVAGHGILVDAIRQSDVTGGIIGNQITSGGQDGIHFDLQDSNFEGSIDKNQIGNNTGYGINFQPTTSRSGIVEEAFDGDPLIITSTNHQLETGDIIIIQGMTNADPSINHPGNGVRTVTRLGNNSFAINGMSGTITAIANPATGDVQITSADHGLRTNDRVRITNAFGALADGDFKVTRIDNDTFSLNGTNATGAYIPGAVAASWSRNITDVDYKAGGAWYVPDFEGGVVSGIPQGDALGMVFIDVKTTEPEGRITRFYNPDPARPEDQVPLFGTDVRLTSPSHGLTSGSFVRISGATGTLIDGNYKITRISDDVFSLDSTNAVGQYDTSEGLARWTTNLITNATNPLTGDIVVSTLVPHNLDTGDRIRIAGVSGNTNANGTFAVTVLGANDFALQGSTGNAIYVPDTGYFTPLKEDTVTLDKNGMTQELTQQMAGNSITVNGKAGIYVDLETGTTFSGDILDNTITENDEKGIYIESHSYGVGRSLPLDTDDPLAVPSKQDLSFDVNIGSDVLRTSPETGKTLDGNILDRNGHAGIVFEVLDLATGSFEIRGNRITRSVDDANQRTGWAGDGIYVTLESDAFPVDSSSLLVESVIDNNTIGVDSQGNDGNGLSFNLTERARIQDLEVVKNFFGNNMLDGFHFVRTENGSLNSVVFEDNDSTNNGSDGFDLYAENSVDDRLDFKIRRNDINNNDEYGLRVNVQAAARIEVDFETNDVLANGANADRTGFHPNDAAANFVGHENGVNFAGNAGAAGGVGIFGFEEVEVVFNAVDSKISGNFGDGFSVDAVDERDTLRLDASFTDVELIGNTLTGARIQGATFASIDLTSSVFDNNREDGLRMVSTIDVDSFFETRVAGADLDVTAIGNSFSGNWHNGAVLGRGVSAVFGTGATTAEFANVFANNGFTNPAITGLPEHNTGGDGLKITQDVGPYLHNLGRRRVIESDGNFFRDNGGDGIDIGHDVNLEGGNVEHGHEVASDVDVIINNAIIDGNFGDGIEYLADGILRVPSFEGGGGHIDDPTDFSSLQVSNSRIESNMGRGIDILNRVNEDSRISIVNNEILTNDLSGVYVMNTSSHFQEQVGPDDALVAPPFETMYNELVGSPATFSNSRTPNIELRVQDNNILDNGNQHSTSTVPIPQSEPARDSTGVRNPDWTHNYRQVTGTLGGLVIRVGTADTSNNITVAFPELELGLSGIDAEVFRNTFNGNFGASVFFDSFTSHIPPQTDGFFDDDSGPPHPFRWDQGYRDPLARLDLAFRENSGNSLDVTNGFAILDNDENYFKSRHPFRSTAPPHGHAHGGTTLTPGGDFINTTRSRNATRTLGYFDSVGQVPSATFVGTGLDWSYDGHGTPTWRVESDYEFGDFGQISTTQGFSTFEDTVALANSDDFFDFDQGSILSADPRYSFQWDTGRNTSTFTGLTPYSLQRGDIFNVQTGEDPIQADGLEENDSFLGATELGVVSGPGFSVNALTAASSQPGILNIDRKGDRDYYRFRTPEAFAAGAPTIINVNLELDDLLGSDLQFMVYEIVPQTDTEELPLVALNGIPQYTTITPGTSNFIQTTAKPDTEYVIEILSDESTNLFDFFSGEVFVYGTARSYLLSIDAPAALAPVRSGSSSDSSSSSDSNSAARVTVTSPGVTASVNITDQDPFVESISDVAAATINTSLNSFTVTFSEDVANVDITDFELTRNGNALDLSNAVINLIDFQTYEITNLASLTAESGDYVFSVLIATSDIVDTDLAALQAGGDDSEAWTVDTSVNSELDTIDNVPGDMLVADSTGNRSLRAAIMEANGNFGPEIIDLPAGNYVLTIDGQFEDQSRTGDLDIRESVTIRGAGVLSTIIDARQLDRVFHVFPDATLTLQNLTIQGGEAFDGAGILVEGNSVFSEPGLNPLTGGTVLLSNVNVIDNEAFNQGGGIYNLGTVEADQSSISRNSAGSRGGGIFNHGDVRLVNTTVSTNFAVSRGGGIYNEIATNRVNDLQDPIRSSGAVYALNSTIAFNRADSTGGGLYQEGTASYQIGNSIVDRNVAEAFPDLQGSINSLGNNFIGILSVDPADAFLTSTDVAGDFDDTVTEAGLNPLLAGANGTLAHTLAAGAFAVDAGSTDLYGIELNLTEEEILADRDQVDSERLVEGNDDGAFSIDIGATEFYVSKPVAIIVATPNPAGVNELVNLDASTSTHTLTPGTGRIVLYEWDFNYEAPNFVVDATGISAATSYPVTGVFLVALRVTDDADNVDVTVIEVTVDRPTAPIVTGPFADGTSDLTPTITWDAGTGTFSLEVTSISSGAIVIQESGLTEPSFTPSVNLAPGTYSAVVTAANASGTESSTPYLFEVIQIDLTDPLNFDVEFDTTPEFTFTAIPDAVTYEIWVAELDPNDRRVTLSVIINDTFIDANQALIPGTGLAQYEPSVQLPEGFYRVWVRAIDAIGNEGDWSAGHQFTIQRPSVTGPAFVSRVTIDSTPLISWTGVGSNQYQVWVSQLNGTDVNGNPVTGPTVVINTIAAGTEFEVPTPLGDGDFRVWVRPVDDDGESGLWSPSYDFTKDLTTGPAQIAPIQGATTTDRTPIFEWVAIEGATHYEIWVNNSTLQIPRVIHNTNVPHVAGSSSIFYTDPSVVLRNATYRWWVRAFNEDGQAGSWTAGDTFFVPTPALTDPIGAVGGTNLPVFTWTGVPEYVRYELWVNNLTTGISQVIYEPDLTGNTFTPTLPLENGSFRAWIRAYDIDGNASQWSNPILFDIDATVANAPIAVNTIAGADNSPTFIWSPIASASSYEILVKNLLTTGQPEVLNEFTAGVPAGANLSYETTTNLASGTYRWWIRGLNADGSPGPWSQPLDFTVTATDQPVNQESADRTIMLTSLPAEQAWTDDLHSITVHPAAVVAAMNPVDTFVSEHQGMATAVTERHVTDPAVDDIMAEMATADWWSLPISAADESKPAEDVAMPIPITQPVESSRADVPRQSGTTAIGLAIAGMKMAKSKTRRRED